MAAQLTKEIYSGRARAHAQAGQPRQRARASATGSLGVARRLSLSRSSGYLSLPLGSPGPHELSSGTVSTLGFKGSWIVAEDSIGLRCIRPHHLCTPLSAHSHRRAVARPDDRMRNRPARSPPQPPCVGVSVGRASVPCAEIAEPASTVIQHSPSHIDLGHRGCSRAPQPGPQLRGSAAHPTVHHWQSRDAGGSCSRRPRL